MPNAANPRAHWVLVRTALLKIDLKPALYHKRRGFSQVEPSIISSDYVSDRTQIILLHAPDRFLRPLGHNS